MSQGAEPIPAQPKPHGAHEHAPKVNLTNWSWIGIGLVGLMPAGGFGAWAWQMGERVAKLEQRQEDRMVMADQRHDTELKFIDAISQNLEKTTERVADQLPRIDQRLVEIERRIDRIEENTSKRGG